MAFRDLREFIAAIDAKGWLARVKAPVDPALEITEITDRLSKSTSHPAGPGGPALLFESVTGATMPVAINLFGTKARMELALGVSSLDDIARRIDELLEIPKPPSGLMEKLALLPKLAELAQFPPKVVSHAPCHEVVHLLEKGPLMKAALFSLPILQCWPQDAGRFITLGAAITRNKATGRRNVGLYRYQVYDERTLGMHWQPHKDGAGHWRGYAPGERMPVAIALGGDPAAMYVASAPLPEGIDEYLFAGFLRKAPVELVKAKTVDLEVPAHAEIILEGYVEVGERREEG
ncbi:MAG: UbiD family decarboxylase, partial [Candidatus Omnitrophica bacterium]|nr:UbiD family decarboxylase [Candidatus Omnitrophota bacterium]